VGEQCPLVAGLVICCPPSYPSFVVDSDLVRILPTSLEFGFSTYTPFESKAFFGSTVRNRAGFIHRLWINLTLFLFLFQVFSIRFMPAQVIDIVVKK
jgi:hypothetical protein